MNLALSAIVDVSAHLSERLGQITRNRLSFRFVALVALLYIKISGVSLEC